MSAVRVFNPETGEWEHIRCIVGPPGPKGDAYNLTEDDKAEIADMVLEQLPVSNIKTISQAEYDALVAAGEDDPEAIYMIVSGAT